MISQYTIESVRNYARICGERKREFERNGVVFGNQYEYQKRAQEERSAFECVRFLEKMNEEESLAAIRHTS